MAGISRYIALIALLGWAPLAAALFAVRPPRRAMVIAMVTAWLVLPFFAIDLPGLPPFGKSTAASCGVLLGTLIFDPGRIRSFRFRWFDLPMIVFCLSPFATSISNNLGMYDGAGAAFRQSTLWFLPYLIGRLYLIDAENFRELAVGMIAGAVCTVPFCFLEMRIGPQLHRLLYGGGEWEGSRYGLYRPRLFFQDGLELGMWLNSAALMAWWLWRRGTFQRLWGQSAGGVVVLLAFTAVACRATGASVLAFAGFLTLRHCLRFRTKWMIWALLTIAPIYCCVRITNIWRAESAVAWVRTYLGEDRAHSLEARLWEEDVLIARAMRRPVLGWGGYNRARVIEDESGRSTGKLLPAVDALWSIFLGNQGFTGLIAYTAMLSLPIMLFLVRFPVRQWDHPDLAAVTALAMVILLYQIDSLLNASTNAIYLMIVGGLGNFVPARLGPWSADQIGRLRAPVSRAMGRRMASPAAGAPLIGANGANGANATMPLAAGDDLAARYQLLGRASKDRGRPAEARDAWRQALDLLTAWAAVHPERSAARRRWCDCANDLAWLLANTADPTVRDPAGAVALATAAAEAAPECAVYHNTLGAARYRGGDLDAAIAALDRATALGDGGTAFDHFYLAMAHARLGHSEDARRWFDLAMIGMERWPPSHAELFRLRDEARAIMPAVAAATP